MPESIGLTSIAPGSPEVLHGSASTPWSGALLKQTEPQWRLHSQLIEAERMSAIGTMACSLSHDMRHSLAAIYASAEFLERQDLCPSD